MNVAVKLCHQERCNPLDEQFLTVERQDSTKERRFLAPHLTILSDEGYVEVVRS